MNEEKSKNRSSEPRREGTAGKKTEGAPHQANTSGKRAESTARRAGAPGNSTEGAVRRSSASAKNEGNTHRRAAAAGKTTGSTARQTGKSERSQGGTPRRPSAAAKNTGNTPRRTVAEGNRPERAVRQASAPGNRSERAVRRPDSPEKRTGGTSRRPKTEERRAASQPGAAGTVKKSAGNAERRQGSTPRRPAASEKGISRTARRADVPENRTSRTPHQSNDLAERKGTRQAAGHSLARRTDAPIKKKGNSEDSAVSTQRKSTVKKTPDKKKKRGGRRLVVVLLVILVLIAAALAAAETGGRFAGGKETKFTVQKGEGTHTIADRLEEEGLIGNSLLFRIVSRFSGGDGEWDYGTHDIAGGSSYKEIISELTSPQTASVKVTLPEGQQVCQMADILEEKGICRKKDFMNACTKKSYSKWPFLKGIKTKERIDGLEGYLFPDTYYFEKNTDPDEVIETMLSRFEEKVYTENVRKKAKKMGFSIDEIVILASMAESEAVTKADRRTVSGVFLNRLEKDDKLQSCVTVEYAKRMKKTIISLEDTKYDSPYNTYMYKGLPFGPICCPSMESIEAVLYNENNDYYYFQSDEKGRLHFAVTFAEHRKIQKEVQKDWKVTTTKIE